jgi:dihydrofolate reductase
VEECARGDIENESLVRKLVVSEWLTVDGVYDADTMPQWFAPYDSAERQAWIKKGVLAADTFLLGRVTYEMLMGYWPTVTDRDNPEIEVADRLNGAPKYVVSSTLKRAPWNNSTIIASQVAKEVARLKQQAGQGILIMGSGTLVQSLIETDLIDEYRFLVHPAFAGSGKRPFRDGMAPAKLELIMTEELSLGVTALSYRSASA